MGIMHSHVTIYGYNPSSPTLSPLGVGVGVGVGLGLGLGVGVEEGFVFDSKS